MSVSLSGIDSSVEVKGVHFLMFINEVSSVLDTTMGAIYEQT